MLRRVFQVHFWEELTLGYSYSAFRGIDMYSCIMSAGMLPPAEEAWYLLNTERAPMYRRQIQPEDWWQCHVLQSNGQRYRINEWHLEATGVVMPLRACM